MEFVGDLVFWGVRDGAVRSALPLVSSFYSFLEGFWPSNIFCFVVMAWYDLYQFDLSLI
jgi:hypothetical protein